MKTKLLWIDKSGGPGVILSSTATGSRGVYAIALLRLGGAEARLNDNRIGEYASLENAKRGCERLEAKARRSEHHGRD